jgi:hypothetical protein
MSDWKSNAEARREWTSAMGTELGELAHELSNEVTVIHWRWTQFEKLYGSGPERISILNRSAPLFFRIVQDVFFEDVLLAIARIVGSSKSAGRANLTIQRLAPLLKASPIHSVIACKVIVVVNAAAFAVDWRNRRLAHRDLDLSLKRAAQPLSGASRQQVKEVLSALRELMNELQDAYGLGVTAYSQSVLTWDADALLPVLQAGLLRQADRQASWDRGKMHDDDKSPPPKL